MKKRQREVRLMRAGIQLAFFIAAPSLFSTAFAGIKSIFLAIAAGQPVEWNSFLTVTAVLLIFTCFFGRHFCGYACAFGSFGDAVYEGFSWIRTGDRIPDCRACHRQFFSNLWKRTDFAVTYLLKGERFP